MLLFLIQPENLAFSVAILLMSLIAITEIISLFLGASFLELISHLSPDYSHTNFPSKLSKILSWLRIDQLPFLVLLIMFLSGFGLSGLAMQLLALQQTSYLLPATWAIIPAGIIGILAIQFTGRFFYAITPRDETSAVSIDSLIGRVATITLGAAKNGYAAQAKVKDHFGKSHYLMVEPENPQDIFTKGNLILILRREGDTFFAVHTQEQRK